MGYKSIQTKPFGLVKISNHTHNLNASKVGSFLRGSTQLRVLFHRTSSISGVQKEECEIYRM